MRSKTAIYAFFDIFFVSLIFTFFLYIKAEPFHNILGKYIYSFLLFLGLWLIVSIASNKYNFYKAEKLQSVISQILLGNILVLGLATTLIYLIRIDYYSRMVVFGTIATATVVELFWFVLLYYLHTATVEPTEVLEPKTSKRRSFLKNGLIARRAEARKPGLKSREEAILVEIDQKAFEFIFNYAKIDSPNTLVVSTTSRFNIETQLRSSFESIVNLKRINDIRYVNKFFESVNTRLPKGGIYIDFVETKNLRKRRILRKYPPLLNYVAYMVDFIIKRLFPKFSATKGLYFFLTRGQNRVFTKAEVYGRLYSCGFEIVEEKYISGHLFFIARKATEPYYPKNPTYGPFIKLERIGYKGKIIKVYKLRTMHPYAEYLQEYIYKTQGLQEGGKFKSDFRISNLGRFLRIFWLDELPMLINLIKGDLKIIGVRPLSRHYFSLYSEELQQRRKNYKPGLIPPFYADNPKTLQEIMDSELRYMDAYDKHPFFTDFKYFFRAFYNIVFRRYRSK